MATPKPSVSRKQKQWSASEIAWLKENYPTKGKMFCADYLGRSESQIRWKASELKLRLDRTSEFFTNFQERAAKSKVGKKRPDQAKVMLRNHAEGKFLFSEERRKLMSQISKDRIAKHGHPRGTLGMKHSKESLAKMAKASKDSWRNKTPEERRAINAKILVARIKNRTLVASRKRGTWKAAWRTIGGKHLFFRSRWEANYARYLQKRKDAGEIREWLHEEDVFTFPADLFGASCYLPDFKVITKDGAVEYHEVKGWMDSRSKAQIAKMAQHFSSVTLIVIDGKKYRAIAKKLSDKIEGWEQ